MNSIATVSVYDELPWEDAEALRSIASEGHYHAGEAFRHWVMLGNALKKGHERLASHNAGFQRWVKEEYQISREQAQRFMDIASQYPNEGTLPPRGGNVGFRALALISAPSTPEIVREQYEQGEITTLKEIEAAKKSALAAEREAARANQLLADHQQEYDAAQERIKSLTRSIDAFQQEAQKPPIIKEVPDPKQLAKIQEQQQQIAQLTKDRADAIRRAAELQQEAQKATEKYFAGENERRIRVQWSSNANRLVKLMREAITLLPPQSELYVFESDDWAYVQEVKQTTRLFQEALAGLSQVTLSVIDAD